MTLQRIALPLALALAFAAQAASAHHLVPGVYTAQGTIDLRVEDRWAGTVRASCEDEAFVGVLRVTGPDTAELQADSAPASDCVLWGWFHSLTLTGTPATGYSYVFNEPCIEVTYVTVGPLGPQTSFRIEQSFPDQYDGAAQLVASESSASCMPDPDWCTCIFWVSEGVIAFE